MGVAAGCGCKEVYRFPSVFGTKKYRNKNEKQEKMNKN